MNKRITIFQIIILCIPVVHIILSLVAPTFVIMAFKHLLLTYGMLLLLTFFHLLFVRIASRRLPEQAALITMGLNLFKMIISIALLFVIVVPLAGKGGATAVNFAVAYLFFLILDSQLAIYILNSEKKSE